MRKSLLAVLVMVALGGAWVSLLHAEDAKPKYTIKEVMKDAHKGGLLKKALKGEAKAEELAKLKEYYVALAAQTPKKGDAEAWKKRTTEILDACTALVDGKDGAAKRLEAATNCGGCHKEFK